MIRYCFKPNNVRVNEIFRSSSFKGFYVLTVFSNLKSQVYIISEPGCPYLIYDVSYRDNRVTEFQIFLFRNNIWDPGSTILFDILCLSNQSNSDLIISNFSLGECLLASPAFTPLLNIFSEEYFWLQELCSSEISHTKNKLVKKGICNLKK